MTGKKDEQEKYLICGEADSSFFSACIFGDGKNGAAPKANKINTAAKERSATYFRPHSFVSAFASAEN